ncbi:MAG: PAS domain-containing protein [Gammaproteobacteria bacterium]|nr:PAS domain-containing protein [Gammaproteobacteria bacterium]
MLKTLYFAAPVLAGSMRLKALHELVEHAPIGMCVLNHNFEYLYVNPCLAAMNGRAVEDHLGHSVAEIVPDLYRRCGEVLHRIVASREPAVEVLITGETAAQPGVVRSWLETWFPIEPPGAEPLMAIAVREVTHEKGLERELKIRDQNKDRFLAMLAHELRNPLGPISNAAELLGAIDVPLAARVQGILHRQLQQLTRLVDDLMDASRIHTGKLEIRMSEIDLGAVVHAAVANVAQRIESKRHRLIVQVPSRPLMVRGDFVRLTQALSNLLNNACKFTPDMGEIGVVLDEDNDAMNVVVRDSGVGIDDEDLPRIFQRFFQVERGRDMSEDGLGLGLWLAKSIAEQHRGTLSVTSEGLGKGATFTLRLPREGSAPSA